MSHSREISGALRPMKEECEQLVRNISFMVWTYNGTPAVWTPAVWDFGRTESKG